VQSVSVSESREPGRTPEDVEDGLERTLRRREITHFRIYDLRSTYATRLSAGGVADEWVTQLLRQGDAKVFKKYSQMKLQMKREALLKLNRTANEQSLSQDLSYGTAGELMGFDTVLTQFATKTQQNEGFRKCPRIRKFVEVV